MATKLNEKIAELEKDGLIASAIPQAEVFTVTLAAGEGTLKRGTVLTLESDGAYSVLGASSEKADEGSDDQGSSDTASTATETAANCILADDVELDATETTNAIAYRTGHFAAQKLIAAEGYAITAADKEALRDVGILVSDVMEY